jgi:hypothetical protein
MPPFARLAYPSLGLLVSFGVKAAVSPNERQDPERIMSRFGIPRPPARGSLMSATTYRNRRNGRRQWDLREAGGKMLYSPTLIKTGLWRSRPTGSRSTVVSRKRGCGRQVGKRSGSASPSSLAGGHHGQIRFPVEHGPTPLARHRGSGGYRSNCAACGLC